MQPRLQNMLVASDRGLAKGCQQLLRSQDFSDMKFIVMPHHALGSSPRSLDNLSDSRGDCGGGGERAASGGEEGVVIVAHRVVVAAGCEYFKRALQSGMKETIDRYWSSQPCSSLICSIIYFVCLYLCVYLCVFVCMHVCACMLLNIYYLMCICACVFLQVHCHP